MLLDDSLRHVMRTEQTVGRSLNESIADDIASVPTTSPGMEKVVEELNELSGRIDTLERLIMVIIDKLELDYPGISL
jgi:hypothetical protein